MDKIDPELQGLLAEIAGQSNARLLRADPARARRILYPDKLGVSARADLLTNAERHLLQAHRSEVGRLLCDYAAVMLTEDPIFGLSLSPSVTVDRDLELPSRAALNRRALHATREVDSREPDTAVDVLARCCASGARAQPSELLEASLRVAPTDKARVVLALDMIRRERLEDARITLGQVLECGPSDLIRSYAWQNIGLLECQRDRFDEATVAYGRSSEAHLNRIAPLLDEFHSALQAGQRAATLETAARIDEVLNPHDPTARTHIHSLVESRRLNAWNPTSKAQQLLHSIRSQLGPATNEIAQFLYY